MEDAWVHVKDGRVQQLGHWHKGARPGGKPVDLGDVVVLPGLINSHCHLDYTKLAGEIPFTGVFGDWIKCITTAKGQWGYSEYADSWVAGADMLVSCGVTTVADIEAAPEILPEAWSATPLRVHSYLEMTGVKSRRAPDLILREAITTLEALPQGRNGIGFSPHALYSTTPALLRQTATAAKARQWRISTHVAESADEFDMFVHARGPLYEWLECNHRDMTDCGAGSPISCLEKVGLLNDRFLAVHVNYLAPGDAFRLGVSGAHVVHCPRSHLFFQHQRFPLAELRRSGVNVCLGTDSLASVKPQGRGRELKLDMFGEMAALAKAEPQVDPAFILQMSTINGARALGLQGLVGQLVPGAEADLIAIPFCSSTEDVFEAVIHHSGPVCASMKAGQWILRT